MKRSFKSVLTPSFVLDMFADSTYDSYWATVSVHKDTPKEMTEDDKIRALFKMSDSEMICREHRWVAALFNGGWVDVFDREEEKHHKIGLKDIEKGFKLLCFNYPRSYADLMTGDCDFYDADAFLQCVAFKDVIYG